MKKVTAKPSPPGLEGVKPVKPIFSDFNLEKSRLEFEYAGCSLSDEQASYLSGLKPPKKK
jgi:hypothetical protein